MITRTQVMLRARFGWPRKAVPFDNKIIHPTSGYRTNSAGYVSMCWDIPLNAPRSSGGMSTVTLLTDGWVKEIYRHELKPGDAVGYLGPDSMTADGNAVIVIFEKWLSGDTALTWEHLPQFGAGPDQHARPVDHQWHCYRFKDIVDDDDAGYLALRASRDKEDEDFEATMRSRKRGRLQEILEEEVNTVDPVTFDRESNGRWTDAA